MVRTLTASNRDEALDPTNPADPALRLPTDTVAAAAALSTVNLYAYDPATGTSDLTDTFGPYHLVTLANGTVTGARAHTHTSYDTGGETGHPAGGLLHLPVTVTAGASLSANPVATNETDVRTTTNEYALSGADATGCDFRQPMKVTTDPGSGHLAIAAVTRYDATTGAVIQTSQPKSNGADAGTTQTIYYTAGTNSADAACGNKPAWATLACVTKPAAQPGASGLPGLVTERVTAYDYLTRPVTVVETVTDAAGTTRTRTTTTSYTSSGFGTDTAGTTLTGGLGASVPATTITYDPATGLPTATSAAATATQTATSQSTGYDDFGRVKTFTDNDQATGNHANTATTVYDGAGRVASVTDAHGSRTYTYNSNGETRDKSTTVTVSGAGAFTATYDADGDLTTQTWPNGLTEPPSPTRPATPPPSPTPWPAPPGSPKPSLHHPRPTVTTTTRNRTTAAAAPTPTTPPDASPKPATPSPPPRPAPPAPTPSTTTATAPPTPPTTRTGGACKTTTAASNISLTYDTADRLQTPEPTRPDLRRVRPDHHPARRGHRQPRHRPERHPRLLHQRPRPHPNPRQHHPHLDPHRHRTTRRLDQHSHQHHQDQPLPGQRRLTHLDRRKHHRHHLDPQHHRPDRQPRRHHRPSRHPHLATRQHARRHHRHRHRNRHRTGHLLPHRRIRQHHHQLQHTHPLRLARRQTTLPRQPRRPHPHGRPPLHPHPRTLPLRRPHPRRQPQRLHVSKRSNQRLRPGWAIRFPPALQEALEDLP